MPKDEFAKVAIVGNQDPLFTMGNSEDVGIFKRLAMVAGNSRDIVAILSKRMRNTCIGALVDQEPHAGVVAASPETRWSRSCSTAARAYSRHALTSSGVSRGKAANRSLTSGLSARWASTRSTGMRVPFTTGFPTIIFG